MKTALVVAALGAASAVPAFAESYSDFAPVVSVQPVMDQVPVNHRECWNEQRNIYEHTVTRQDNGSPVGPGTILGAVVGGVLGHQMGSSSGGRDRGTAAGAIVGGLVGNQIDRQNNNDQPPQTVTEARPVTVEKCRTVQEIRQVPSGYDVRYRYNGREFVTRMPYDPGRRIRLAVNVDVVMPPPPPPPPPGRY